jgi:RNA polymerase sigma factor (sigma-70 family)
MATDLRRPSAALDPLTFEHFYERHQREIYRYVLQDVGNRADAEEVTQTAFLEAFRALRRGHEPEQPRAWMYGIARNAARRRYRTQSRRPREVELAPSVVERAAAEDEGPFVGAVRAAFASLRPNHRDVVFLREVEGLSYAEIGKRLGLSQSAVETLLFRARRALREALEAEGVAPAVSGRRPVRNLGLAAVPAFLGKLADRAQHILAPEVATKAAGAVTAVALSTGMVIGTKAAIEAYAGPAPPVREAVAAPASDLPSTAPRWVEPGTAPTRPAAPRAAAGTRERSPGDSKGKGGKDERGTRSSPGSKDGGMESSGASGTQAGSGESGSAGGGAVVSTPSVTIPSATVTAPISTPVDVPSVTTPAVEVPGLEVEVPDVGATVEETIDETVDGLLGR